MKDHKEVFQDEESINAILNLIDIISIRWKTSGLANVKKTDPEEYIYQETLMS